MANKNYAPKLPLELDDTGNFINISDILLNIKQKLKMLILTNPGEKLMEPQFGVGIRKYLFEQTSGMVEYGYVNGTLDTVAQKDFQQTIQNAIIKQVAQYSNDIIINSAAVTIQEQELYLNLDYSYRGIYTDSLELTVGL